MLDRRALNRALLARQFLVDRRSMAATKAVEHLVGIQAQEPQAAYLGLWSRVAGFTPEELSSLVATRAVVRGQLMRATIHLVTAQDWAWLWTLTAPARARVFRATPFAKAIAGVDLDKVLGNARELLAETPRSRAELGRLLAAAWPNTDPQSLAYAATYLLPVVQVPPRGQWRKGTQARWAIAPAAVEREPHDAPGLDALLFRYLAAFGPATVQDVQAWSGLPRLGPVVERLRDRLRAFTDEKGRELFDVPDGPLPDPTTAAPPRFLPPFDNSILAHADRDRILNSGDRAAVYRDRLLRVFLIDGFVAGTWQIDDATLHIRPVRAPRATDRRALIEEAERLLTFLAPDTSDIHIELTP